MPSQKGDFIPGEELGSSISHPKRKTYLWGTAGGAWNCPESEVNLTFSVGGSLGDPRSPSRAETYP